MSEQQIRIVYRDTIDRLYGYVSRHCEGGRALAKDVTQETWLRAVREWRRKGVPDSPIAWLTTVARNLLLNELRRPPAADARRHGDRGVRGRPATASIAWWDSSS